MPFPGEPVFALLASWPWTLEALRYLLGELRAHYHPAAEERIVAVAAAIERFEAWRARRPVPPKPPLTAEPPPSPWFPYPLVEDPALPPDTIEFRLGGGVTRRFGIADDEEVEIAVPLGRMSCARDSDWCDGRICRERGIDCPNADPPERADDPLAERFDGPLAALRADIERILDTDIEGAMVHRTTVTRWAGLAREVARAGGGDATWLAREMTRAVEREIDAPLAKAREWLDAVRRLESVDRSLDDVSRETLSDRPPICPTCGEEMKREPQGGWSCGGHGDTRHEVESVRDRESAVSPAYAKQVYDEHAERESTHRPLSPPPISDDERLSGGIIQKPLRGVPFGVVAAIKQPPCPECGEPMRATSGESLGVHTEGGVWECSNGHPLAWCPRIPPPLPDDWRCSECGEENSGAWPECLVCGRARDPIEHVEAVSTQHVTIEPAEDLSDETAEALRGALGVREAVERNETRPATREEALRDLDDSLARLRPDSAIAREVERDREEEPQPLHTFEHDVPEGVEGAGPDAPIPAPEGCHEEIEVGGKPEPCGRPVVGVAFDRPGTPYPACDRHAQHPHQWPAWTCPNCEQRNSGWSRECGRCDATRPGFERPSLLGRPPFADRPLCDTCWSRLQGDREPVRLTAHRRDPCVVCGSPTDGIALRLSAIEIDRARSQVDRERAAGPKGRRSEPPLSGSVPPPADDPHEWVVEAHRALIALGRRVAGLKANAGLANAWLGRALEMLGVESVAEMRALFVSDTPVTPHVIWRAFCERCGATADLDGGEFTTSPERAIDVVLDEDWQRRDGKLLCGDCVVQEDG